MDGSRRLGVAASCWSLAPARSRRRPTRPSSAGPPSLQPAPVRGAAIAAAERARLTPAWRDRADLIAARAYLERYRESTAAEDLTNARERLRRLDPRRFDSRERTEFIVGLGEALYFDESYGAAADVFETVLDNGAGLDGGFAGSASWTGGRSPSIAMRGCERRAARQAAYQRIRARMRDELTARPGSATAAYWLAAAARAQGDLQAAWDAAEAGWVRASLATDRGAGAAGRSRSADDRRDRPGAGESHWRSPADTLRLEWEKFKERWGGIR